ncbi:MAG TPA: hypothetical protein VJV22_11890 [Acidobacteriaceae bacterium]|nr:hypothetical protein [Acidobacteriaceae bacterium]
MFRNAFVAAILASASLLPAQSAAHGIAVSDMDRTIKPGDNFYLYANGD